MLTPSEDRSTTLHVVFGGLCLLVRDEARNDREKMLHVLFPAHGPGAAHRAALLVHPDFRVPEDSNKPHEIPLGGVDLDLPSAIAQVAGEINGTTLFPNIADEGCFGGYPVPHALLKDIPHGLVKAKITLTAGQQGSRKNQGAEWHLGQCRRSMGTWVHWEIGGIPAGDFNLQCGTERLRLRPKNREIELVFLHERHIPGQPPLISQLPTAHGASRPMPAHHFRAFYPLVKKGENDPVPIHGNWTPVLEHEHGHTATPGENKGLDYTCIMATAPVDTRP